MRKECDFSKSRKNPYAKMLKKQITIRLEADVIDYFKGLAESSGISYRSSMSILHLESATRLLFCVARDES
ncbi:MAG: BrnA antitoxin family protein [Nitrospinae bacterium]|nr:BrnA antitoxin family protein [Nitrospinota bacterium]